MLRCWTIGREREKWHAAKFVRKPDQQAILFPVIDAVHDLKDGKSNVSNFVTVARAAMIEGGFGVRTNTSNWIAKVAAEIPEVAGIWDELAQHSDWNVRWRVACGLYYFGISEPQSDRLFSILRHDRSKKVREYALSRYERRPNPRNVERIFDASEFDERVRRGEVTI